MDLTHLRYFQKVAHCGSLTKAARELGVSQPALTVAVRNLEERLGTTLVIRGRSGVTVTATGAALLVHAAEIFAAIERAEQDLAGLQGDEVGRFTLGCHESLAAYFLPGFMPPFLKRAPRVELSLWNGTSRNVQDAVLKRDVHFGLVVNPAPYPDLVIVPLFHDAVDILCHRDMAGAVRSLDDALLLIRTGPLLHAGRVSQSQDILERLAAINALPQRTLSCGDLELVKSLALAGVGVAVLPRRVAAYHHEGALVRLHAELPSFPDVISLLYRADLHRTRAAMLLKNELVEYGKTLDSVSDVTAPLTAL